MRDGVYIVATARDGTKRLFEWAVAGAGPDNTWSMLSSLVARNLAAAPADSFEAREARPFEIIRIQATRLEPIGDALGRPR